MGHVSKGLLAGFVATVALSLLMVMKNALGLMPELNIIAMLTNMASNWVGLPATPVVGWLIHFMVGTILYGLVFAFFHTKLPGHSESVQGMVLGIIGWMIMMIVLMPMMGQGLFGINLGVMAPVMTFLLHIIFGAVLGWSYHALTHKTSTRREAHA